MNTHKPSEQGQIVILLMLVMVVLLAFTALAIDGGMVFSDRRHAQSVADSASLAGAGAAANYLRGIGADPNLSGICSEIIDSVNNLTFEDVVAQSAINRASLNDATIPWENNIEGPPPGTHGVDVKCGNREYVDIIVRISGHTDTAFAHLIFNNQLAYTVESVTRVYANYTPGFGNTIVSLSPNCGTNQGGIEFDGSNITLIRRGGIHSNSCLIKNGTSGTIQIDEGSIVYGTTANSHMMDPAKVSPSPTQGPSINPWEWMNATSSELENRCRTVFGTTGPGSFNHPINHQGDTPNDGISPGNYSRMRLNSTNHQLILQPGLYCIHTELTVNGDQMRDIEKDGKNGVTFFLMQGADVSINGNVDVTLSAPQSQDDEVYGSMAGVLFFMKSGYAGNLSINGTSSSTYTGGIYAPNAMISVGGTSDLNGTYNIQVIGWDVKVHGGAGLTINYDPSGLPEIPSRFSVLK